MLQDINLKVRLNKDEYKSVIETLEISLGQLQRQAKQAGIPVMVVFEGMSAAGKGTLINRLILPLDPRGFKVYTVKPPDEEQALRPFLWRFWVKTPERGRIHLFDRSWYQRVFSERVENGKNRADCLNDYEEINSFEEQLTRDGMVIIKYYLHISSKEQQKRFKKFEENPESAWRVTKKDWEKSRRYDEYLQAGDEMIEATDTVYAPWTIVEAHDTRYAAVKIMQEFERRIQERLNQVSGGTTTLPEKKRIEPAMVLARNSILDSMDMSHTLDKAEYDKKLGKLQDEFRSVQFDLYRHRIPMIILFEGWDAAGKGGNIRRLTANLDPRGYEVVPIAAPTALEKAHHYLWRFWKNVPKAGHIAIFDRTWYGRILVERIENYCTETEWKRAYQEINEMEEQFTSFGIVVVKFFLHITPEEQIYRFETRQNDPAKQWKITEEDWRNREKWALYKEAYEDMLLKTSTTYAPWTIVESNCKRYARIKVLETAIKAAERKIKAAK